MPMFRCKKCGRTVKAEYEQSCKPENVCVERYPECRGQLIIEIVDYC